jgi:hypothetical protein
LVRNFEKTLNIEFKKSVYIPDYDSKMMIARGNMQFDLRLAIGANLLLTDGL